MSVIIIPRKHYTQPKGRVTVAQAYTGTAFVIPGVSRKNAPVELTDAGEVLRFHDNYASGGRYAISEDAGLAQPGERGVTAVFYGRFGPGGSRYFTYRLGGGLGIDVRASEVYVGMSTQTGAWAYNMPSTHTSAVITYNGVSGSSAQLSSFANGEKNVSTMWQQPVGTVSRGNGIAYVGNSESIDRQWYGDIGLFAVIPRHVTDEEGFALAANPWQLFRADPVRIYSLPSGAITLNSLTASNITQTGARITLGLTR